MLLRLANKSRSNLTAMIRSSACEAAFKRQREPRRGVLASFALAIGTSLCSPANAYAPMAHEHIKTDKQITIAYYKTKLDKTHFNCLLKLYSKESAWDRTAYNKSGAYGIPQLKNSMIANMSGIQQVHYGIKYINHRYHGDACLALQHWKRYGWH